MTRRDFLVGSMALAGCSMLPSDDGFWVDLGSFRCSYDYYMVDGIRTPLGLHDAMKVASSFDASLPTKEQVDAIWKAADLKLAPIPLTPGPKMSSQAYWEKHDMLIDRQIERRMEDINMIEPKLIAGHKKDILIPRSPEDARVTIYGWHRLNGKPIQPISRVHGASYFDYSHGIRLVQN